MYLIIAICFSSFAPIWSLYHNVYIFDHHALYVSWWYFISLIWLITDRICNMLWIRIMSNKKNQWWAGNYHRSAGEIFLSQQSQGYVSVSNFWANPVIVFFEFSLTFSHWILWKWNELFSHEPMQSESFYSFY